MHTNETARNTAPSGPLPAELGHAGSVVDRAISHMSEQRISAMAIGAALLGGAIAVLARTLDDPAIVAVLRQAIASVEAGDLAEDVPPAPQPRA
jgi:hypothetical protein